MHNTKSALMIHNRYQWLSLCAGLIIALMATMPVHASSDLQQQTEDRTSVDCVLPGVIRKLGANMTYITQRRLITTTGGECALRGGTYELYDNDDHKDLIK